jgi:hypothetical protein
MGGLETNHCDGGSQGGGREAARQTEFVGCPLPKSLPRDCTRIGWRLAVDDPLGVLAPGHLWDRCPCLPLTRAPDRRWPRRPVIGDHFENSPHSEANLAVREGLPIFHPRSEVWYL